MAQDDVPEKRSDLLLDAELVGKTGKEGESQRDVIEKGSLDSHLRRGIESVGLDLAQIVKKGTGYRDPHVDGNASGPVGLGERQSVFGDADGMLQEPVNIGVVVTD